MDDYLKPEFDDVKPLGSVKMTVQKFYRINGGATQLKGVTPDIIVPDAYSLIDRGEKESDYPMPWDEIKPANYSTWNKGIGAYIRAEENSKKRIQSNPAFKLVTQQAEKYKRQTDKTLLSMNLEKYRKEEKTIKDENKKFEDIYKEIPDETISNLAIDIPTIESDTQKVNRNKEWLKNLKKDPYIFEATNVLNDMK